MNPVEEAVAGEVGAEPAGGRNDHGQCWPAVVCAVAGSTSLGLGHGPNLLAGAEIRVPPGQKCPAPAEFPAVERPR